MIPHNVALSADETDQMSDLLAAKYIARADELTPTLIEATSVVLAARLSRYLYDQRNRPDENETLRDACVLCEGMYLEDRVTVDKRNHVATPCWVCRPRAFCAYHAAITQDEEASPPTLRTGAPLRPEIKRGLEMLREGSPESGQRMTTVHVLPSLRAAGLVEVRNDAYYLTYKGQEAIR